jgi:hypothetical protein
MIGVIAGMVVVASVVVCLATNSASKIFAALRETSGYSSQEVKDDNSDRNVLIVLQTFNHRPAPWFCLFATTNVCRHQIT